MLGPFTEGFFAAYYDQSEEKIRTRNGLGRSRLTPLWCLWGEGAGTPKPTSTPPPLIITISELR